jgi:hypothetical protein
MTSMPVNQLSIELLASEFFEQSAGRWKSQRRYYTLKQDVEPQEVVSDLSIRFLEQGSPELVKLAQLHQLEDVTALLCGTEVTWESNYTGKSRKPSVGATIFGVKDNILYRDRGFATTEPVIATYSFTNPKTFCLRTEYDGSVFEEEIKLIGDNYRTRQTIISRAGQELTIGQYLEKRLA